jgi:hypothetical protein
MRRSPLFAFAALALAACDFWPVPDGRPTAPLLYTSFTTDDRGNTNVYLEEPVNCPWYPCWGNAGPSTVSVCAGYEFGACFGVVLESRATVDARLSSTKPGVIFRAGLAWTDTTETMHSEYATVTPPMPIAGLRGPIGPVSAAMPLTLTWDAAPGHASWKHRVRCDGSVDGGLNDPDFLTEPLIPGDAVGQLTIPAGYFSNAVTATDCTLIVVVTRSAFGEASPPFQSGSTLAALQEAPYVVSIVP